MGKESLRPDPRLRQNRETDENTPREDKEKKLIVVKKKENNLKYHEKPFDEHMHDSFEEIKKDRDQGDKE